MQMMLEMGVGELGRYHVDKMKRCHERALIGMMRGQKGVVKKRPNGWY